MPQLTAIAQAVRLAVRATSETLRAEATQTLLEVRPLVMQATGYVRLAAKVAAETLALDVHQVSIASRVLAASRLLVDARTHDIPTVANKSSLISAQMIGDVMLG